MNVSSIPRPFLALVKQCVAPTDLAYSSASSLLTCRSLSKSILFPMCMRSCLYVCMMYVCMYVCMCYVCMYHVWYIHYVLVCVYVCMHLRAYVCTYTCNDTVRVNAIFIHVYNIHAHFPKHQSNRQQAYTYLPKKKTFASLSLSAVLISTTPKK